MKLLGIDYGRSKIGLAIGVGGLAEPYKVLRVPTGLAKAYIKEVCDKEGIERIVVGVSENEMGKESSEFADSLTDLGLSVLKFDETLTTHDAAVMSREAGVGPKKLKGMEDAYAASIMLQNYLDTV